MKLPFTIDLDGKVAVITGAGGVLMSEFARALAACGAKVALLDINREAIDALAAEIGEHALPLCTDCLKKEEITAAKDAVTAAFGRVDLLINGAGGNHPSATCQNETMSFDTSLDGSFFDLDEAGLRFVFDLNITSAFLVTQVFAKEMLENGGNIINISSMNAYHPLTKIPAYSAAKAGISNFTEWLAVHFAPVGIRVNAIAPGMIATEMNNRFSEETISAIGEETPLGRIGTAEEVAALVAFLTSEEASFITGSTWIIFSVGCTENCLLSFGRGVRFM